MKAWQTDDDLFDLAKRDLYTAVVGDVLDKLGFQQPFFTALLTTFTRRYGGHRPRHDRFRSRCFR